MKILYVAVGSRLWGMGHLKRSLGLVDVLRKKRQIVFAVAVIPDDQESYLSGAVKGYDRYILELKELENIEVEGIVVDVHTDFQPELFVWLKKKNKPVVALDWYFKKGGVIKRAINLRGGTEALKFALIREEISRQKKSVKTLDVVVVLGVEDAFGCLYWLRNIFTKDPIYQKKKIRLIVGPMAKGKILRLAGKLVGTVKILRDPRNLARIMSAARVGITNAGTSLMEFSSLGVPTLVFPQSGQEEKFMKVFLHQGGSVLGENDSQRLRQQLLCLWDDPVLWKKRSCLAQKLIDGRGVKRTAQAILQTFQERRMS